MRLILMTKKQVMLVGVMIMVVMMLKTVILLMMVMIMTSLIILNITAGVPICYKCLCASEKLLHLAVSHTIKQA